MQEERYFGNVNIYIEVAGKCRPPCRVLRLVVLVSLICVLEYN